MKNLILYLTLYTVVIAGLSSAAGQDSLSINKFKPDSLQKNLDQWSSREQHVLDSLQRLTDFDHRMDSLKVVIWADSLRQSIAKGYQDKSSKLQRQIDSLRGYSLPTGKLQAKLDRLTQKQNKINSELNQKQNALQATINHRYQSYTSDLQSKLKLKSPQLNLPQTRINIPTGRLPSTNIPGISTTLPKPPVGLNTTDFKSLNLSRDLKRAGGKLSIPNTQLSQWESNVPALRQLKSLKSQGTAYRQALKDPLVSGEKMIEQMDALKAVQKEIPGMKDGASMQQQGITLAKNHFEGKEKELKSAMDQMAKYKLKYPSLPNLDEAKKHWWLRNSLRGMRFAERFRIGVALGFRTGKDTIHFDLFPTLSYRLTGRIEAGIGGIYRMQVNTKNYTVGSNANNQWGLSAFTVVKTFKSVYMRFEADGISRISDGSQSWIMSYLSGIQTYFPIASRMKGNIQMLYSFDRKLKDSFPDRLVMRIGVQWRFK